MKVLIACEESQRVCCAFRELGHEAYSCDIQECSGGHPEWHIRGDVLLIIDGHCSFFTEDGMLHFIEEKWDLLIAHPPCTYLTNASAVRMRVNGEIVQDRYEKMLQGKKFFLKMLNADCDCIAVENPVPMKLCGLPPYTQIIQPWQFGDMWTKRTCLWLKNLPQLTPWITIKPQGVYPWVNGGCKDSHGNYRRFQGRKERDPKIRSKTFPGIAKAMAEQWGGDIRENQTAYV